MWYSGDCLPGQWIGSHIEHLLQVAADLLATGQDTLKGRGRVERFLGTFKQMFLCDDLDGDTRGCRGGTQRPLLTSSLLPAFVVARRQVLVAGPTPMIVFKTRLMATSNCGRTSPPQLPD